MIELEIWGIKLSTFSLCAKLSDCRQHGVCSGITEFMILPGLQTAPKQALFVYFRPQSRYHPFTCSPGKTVET